MHLIRWMRASVTFVRVSWLCIALIAPAVAAAGPGPAPRNSARLTSEAAPARATLVVAADQNASSILVRSLDMREAWRLGAEKSARRVHPVCDSSNRLARPRRPRHAWVAVTPHSAEFPASKQRAQRGPPEIS